MHVKDSKALFGASALIFTGVVLSIMTYQYFAGQFTHEAVGHSRSWWEVAMNAQVLALASMWFCYSDAVRQSDRRKANLMRVRMAFGMTGVMVPFFITVLSVSKGWFVERAPLSVVDAIFAGMLIFWSVSTVGPRLLAMRSKNMPVTIATLWRSVKPKSVFHIGPLLLAMSLLGVDSMAQTHLFYIWVPVLLYMQSAVPYCVRGLGRGTAPIMVRNSPR